jgi:hypothetical protein
MPRPWPRFWGRAQERSADPYTLTREIIKEIENQAQNAELLKGYMSRARLIARLLTSADVPARVVYALMLEDGRRRQELVEYLQVFKDNDYELFDPHTGIQGQPANMLLWEYNSAPLLDITGGRNSRVTFSMIEQKQPVSVALAQKQELSDRFNISIHSLPLEEQALFRTILLIPIGALIVVLLRIWSASRPPAPSCRCSSRWRSFKPPHHRPDRLPAHRVGRPGDPQLSLAPQPVTCGEGLGGDNHRDRDYFGVLGHVLPLRSQRRPDHHLLPDDHPVVDHRTHVHPVGRRRLEGSPHPRWRQPGDRCRGLFGYDQSVGTTHHFQLPRVQLILMAMILMIGNYTGYRLLELHRFKPITER